MPNDVPKTASTAPVLGSQGRKVATSASTPHHAHEPGRRGAWDKVKPAAELNASRRREVLDSGSGGPPFQRRGYASDDWCWSTGTPTPPGSLLQPPQARVHVRREGLGFRAMPEKISRPVGQAALVEGRRRAAAPRHLCGGRPPPAVHSAFPQGAAPSPGVRPVRGRALGVEIRASSDGPPDDKALRPERPTRSGSPSSTTRLQPPPLCLAAADVGIASRRCAGGQVGRDRARNSPRR